jgi:hypothetical protein
MADEVKSEAQRGIYKIGAISAALILVLFAAELAVVAARGMPPVFGGAGEWLQALQRDRLAGLVRTFALDIVAVALHAPLYVALVFFLGSYRKDYPILILSATIAFIGMAVFLSSNATFSMLYLSDKLSSAATEAQRSSVLQSAEATMAVYWNGTGYDVATNFAGMAGLLVSVVMLRSRKMPASAAILGIVGNALELGPPAILMPPLYLKLDPIAIVIGGLLLLPWYAAIMARLWKAPGPPREAISIESPPGGRR